VTSTAPPIGATDHPKEDVDHSQRNCGEGWVQGYGGSGECKCLCLESHND
jgi:hypothetical protein